MRSIRFFNRARTSRSQRGFALILAIGIAIVFFLLVELMLIDSARELKEARRYRSKVIAATLAENGAELAATQIIRRNYARVSANDWQGKIRGEMSKSPTGMDQTSGQFVITADGSGTGTEPAAADVRVQGRVEGEHIYIDYTQHSQ